MNDKMWILDVQNLRSEPPEIEGSHMPQGVCSLLVHLTTGNALFFAAPGALATLDLGLSIALVCSPICEIALAENGVVWFFAYNTKSYLRVLMNEALIFQNFWVLSMSRRKKCNIFLKVFKKSYKFNKGSVGILCIYSRLHIQRFIFLYICPT